jgi:hypothetical protein
MTQNSALDAVMDQAAAAADSFTPGTAPAPATTGGAVQQYEAPSAPSLDSMADNAGIQVDAYLSVKETGLRIDKNPVFQDAKVTIDLTECTPIFSVRANRGGQTTFIKSYDGRMTSQGENFQQATARLQATHEKVDGPYQTVEIPVTLLSDVPGAKKGARLGITPAITGVKFWTKFYNELRAAGLQRAKVEAKIVCTPQTNKNGNEWGVVSFELVGEAKA